jgi:hypothetical protein
MKKRILATMSMLVGSILILSCTDKTTKVPTAGIVHECLGATCLLRAVPGDDVMLISVAGYKHKIMHEDLSVEQITAVTWTFPGNATLANNTDVTNAFGRSCGEDDCTTNSNPTAVIFANTDAQVVNLTATINGFTAVANTTETITPADEDPTSITATGSCDGQVCTLTSELDTTNKHK